LRAAPDRTNHSARLTHPRQKQEAQHARARTQHTHSSQHTAHSTQHAARSTQHTAHTRHTRTAHARHTRSTRNTQHTQHTETQTFKKKRTNCSKDTGSRRREGRGRAVQGSRRQTNRQSKRHTDTGPMVEPWLTAITRPNSPRHTKNHDFRAGDCSGDCWFLKEKEAFLF